VVTSHDADTSPKEEDSSQDLSTSFEQVVNKQMDSEKTTKASIIQALSSEELVNWFMQFVPLGLQSEYDTMHIRQSFRFHHTDGAFVNGTIRNIVQSSAIKPQLEGEYVHLPYTVLLQLALQLSQWQVPHHYIPFIADKLVYQYISCHLPFTGQGVEHDQLKRACSKP